MRPEVSVVIPSLDEERVIGACLEALARLERDGPPFEVVLVDNGSKDRTLDIARTFSRRLDLAVVRRPGATISALRNLGAARSRGGLLAFLDADCLPPPRWLKRGRALLARGGLGVLGAHYRIPAGSSWVARAWYGGLHLERQGPVGWVPAGGMMIARSTFERLGGFDASLRTNEDCELCERVRAAGLRVVADRSVAVVHLGTPQTLAQFYRKNLWHGADGLRVFLRGLPRVTNPRPLLLGAATAACAAGAALEAALHPGRLAAPALPVGALLGLMAALALRRAAGRRRWKEALPLTVLNLTYGLARAHALLRAAGPGAPRGRGPGGGRRAGRVLLLTQYLHLGGLERMVLRLSESLQARGEWEPRVYVFDRLPGAVPGDTLVPAFARSGIAVELSVKRPGFCLRTLLAVRRKLAEEDISVLHTHDLGALVYGACAKLLRLGRLRLVHTQHSFVHLARRPVYARYERLFTRLADEVAVVSEAGRRAYAELGLRRRIHVIPNGLRFPEAPPPRASEREGLRRRLLEACAAPVRGRLEPLLDSRWLLYMARLHGSKGQDRALELWARLSPRVRGGAALVFVGPESEPGLADRLRAGIGRAPDSERIVYAGPTRSPELWLAGCDAALSCSEHEGLPSGPIEAAGAGLPLVLSAIPGHAALRGCSRQFPLRDLTLGARRVEEALERAGRDDEGLRRRAWRDARGLRARYSTDRMGRAYSRLYGRPRGNA